MNRQYYDRYLKYKAKYLDLQDRIRSANLVGGDPLTLLLKKDRTPDIPNIKNITLTQHTRVRDSMFEIFYSVDFTFDKNINNFSGVKNNSFSIDFDHECNTQIGFTNNSGQSVGNYIPISQTQDISGSKFYTNYVIDNMQTKKDKEYFNSNTVKLHLCNNSEFYIDINKKKDKITLEKLIASALLLDLVNGVYNCTYSKSETSKSKDITDHVIKFTCTKDTTQPNNCNITPVTQDFEVITKDKDLVIGCKERYMERIEEVKKVLNTKVLNNKGLNDTQIKSIINNALSIMTYTTKGTVNINRLNQDCALESFNYRYLEFMKNNQSGYKNNRDIEFQIIKFELQFVIDMCTEIIKYLEQQITQPKQKEELKKIYSSIKTKIETFQKEKSTELSEKTMAQQSQQFGYTQTFAAAPAPAAPVAARVAAPAVAPAAPVAARVAAPAVAPAAEVAPVAAPVAAPAAEVAPVAAPAAPVAQAPAPVAQAAVAPRRNLDAAREEREKAKAELEEESIDVGKNLATGSSPFNGTNGCTDENLIKMRDDKEQTKMQFINSFTRKCKDADIETTSISFKLLYALIKKILELYKDKQERNNFLQRIEITSFTKADESTETEEVAQKILVSINNNNNLVSKILVGQETITYSSLNYTVALDNAEQGDKVLAQKILNDPNYNPILKAVLQDIVNKSTLVVPARPAVSPRPPPPSAPIAAPVGVSARAIQEAPSVGVRATTKELTIEEQRSKKYFEIITQNDLYQLEDGYSTYIDMINENKSESEILQKLIELNNKPILSQSEPESEDYIDITKNITNDKDKELFNNLVKTALNGYICLYLNRENTAANKHIDKKILGANFHVLIESVKIRMQNILSKYKVSKKMIRSYLSQLKPYAYDAIQNDKSLFTLQECQDMTVEVIKEKGISVKGMIILSKLISDKKETKERVSPVPPAAAAIKLPAWVKTTTSDIKKEIQQNADKEYLAMLNQLPVQTSSPSPNQLLNAAAAAGEQSTPELRPAPPAPPMPSFGGPPPPPPAPPMPQLGRSALLAALNDPAKQAAAESGSARSDSSVSLASPVTAVSESSPPPPPPASAAQAALLKSIAAAAGTSLKATPKLEKSVSPEEALKQALKQGTILRHTCTFKNIKDIIGELSTKSELKTEFEKYISNPSDLKDILKKFIKCFNDFVKIKKIDEKQCLLGELFDYKNNSTTSDDHKNISDILIRYLQQDNDLKSYNYNPTEYDTTCLKLTQFASREKRKNREHSNEQVVDEENNPFAVGNINLDNLSHAEEKRLRATVVGPQNYKQSPESARRDAEQRERERQERIRLAALSEEERAAENAKRLAEEKSYQQAAANVLKTAFATGVPNLLPPRPTDYDENQDDEQWGGRRKHKSHSKKHTKKSSKKHSKSHSKSHKSKKHNSKKHHSKKHSKSSKSSKQARLLKKLFS